MCIDGAAWFPDGKHLAVIVAEKDKNFSTVELDTGSGALTPLTAAGTRGRLVSPDGRWLAVSSGALKQLLDLRTKVLTPLPGLKKDGIVGWSPDARAVYTAQPAGHAVRLFRVDIASGARAELSTVQPPDPSGLVELSELSLAADGDHFVHTMTRQLSQLFLLKLAQ
jgi:hypothetical protein